MSKQRHAQRAAGIILAASLGLGVAGPAASSASAQTARPTAPVAVVQTITLPTATTTTTATSSSAMTVTNLQGQKVPLGPIIKVLKKLLKTKHGKKIKAAFSKGKSHFVKWWKWYKKKIPWWARFVLGSVPAEVIFWVLDRYFL